MVERIRASEPKVVCFDGNLAVETMAAILKHCEEKEIPSASLSLSHTSRPS